LAARFEVESNQGFLPQPAGSYGRDDDRVRMREDEDGEDAFGGEGREERR
jgi:hypothetical protein